ncbi:ABC transporter ATP-binding protein [Sporosalibacterium faouarense]|uniref:ABC transporter ATP-binding protein n=1 Tax=Sporosalibacterium faouarense TaxID=516123 RepID=UPI00141D1B16|nr:ABC transporter ATP-binding protein [Sporosalibacterium faouarense]MTI48601.1 ABC transporter ATP-binding protein [Bacillota bacterium]
MANIHNEETLGKAYDSKLMKRLLSYAKPYWFLILISIILVMFVTGTQLARPYIIKLAIDDHISAHTTPMYVFNKGDSPVDGIEFEDKIYVRENKLSQEQKERYMDLEKEMLIKEKGDYYLINGIIEIESQNVNKSEITVKEDNGNYNIVSNNKEYSARLLSNEEYSIFRENDLNGLSNLGIIFLTIIVLGFIFNYAQVYILNYASKKIIFNMRQEIFSHLQKMSLAYFDKNPVGRLVTRTANDTERLNEMYTDVMVNLFRDIFKLVGIIIIMLQLNLKLALLSFTVVPFILIASAIFRYHIRHVYRAVRIKIAKINSTLNENITGMKTVHIFKKENKKFREFDEINTDYLETTKKQVKIFATFRPAIEIIRSVGIALIIWYGGGRVLMGAVEFGVLYAFINYLQEFFRPIMELTQKYNILQAAMASSERIFKILDTKPDIKTVEKPKSLKKIKGKIEFKNVWFAYEKENWVLRDVSFTINPGESVALVGATGAGKSSIINLINRFYDIQKGEILIDGKNIKEIDKYELRKHIGIVLQDVFLFTGNIRDNIRLNNENIDQDKVEEVAKYVNAHKFISKLPSKYDEPVMERGSTLSSGQRQLLAFARSLAFDPDILVLDEATSNIDTETEVLIQDALLKLIQNRTSIAIAHRLSTIQHSDKIIVLHKGKIREMGNHQELLDKGGIYYDLYRLQYKENFTPEDSEIL